MHMSLVVKSDSPYKREQKLTNDKGIYKIWLSVVVYACNSRTWEMEARGLPG
jgi:hypothetical protein